MSVHRPTVIIGGGVAGLAVAKALSDNGWPCVIVEKDRRLGGRVADWPCVATESCQRCFACSVEDVAHEVQSSPHVTTLLGHRISSVARDNGNAFRVGVRAEEQGPPSLATGGDTNVEIDLGDSLQGGGSESILEASAVVVATGFEPYDPTEKGFWGYGQVEGVLTLKDLNVFLRNDDLAGFAGKCDQPLRVAFLQCVGSRDRSIGANYCSHYCCQSALRTALKLRSEFRDWDITVFYIDLQIPGKLAADLVQSAIQRNVRLIQGVPGEIVPRSDGHLDIVREDSGRNIHETYDRIVLSIGQRPSESSAHMGEMLGLEADEFGFLASRHGTDSCRTAIPGVYLAGTCGGPKTIEETLLHASETAWAILSDQHTLLTA
ncbi:MAG: FAD-dependent oxidoreductase [Thermodesulfobacteriota bacterium]